MADLFVIAAERDRREAKERLRRASTGRTAARKDFERKTADALRAALDEGKPHDIH